MRNKFIPFLLSLLVYQGLSAQDTYVQATLRARLQKIASAIDTYRNARQQEIQDDMNNDHYFSSDGYDHYFDKYFTLIKYDRESFTEGNSAALRVADNKTTLNLTLSKKKKNTIFSVGTALNITDNSGVIFSGDRPTAGTEFFGSFSFLIPGLRKIEFRGPSADLNYRKRQRVVDSIWLIHNRKNPYLGELLLQKLNQQNELLNKYDLIVNDPHTNEFTRLQYKDSLVGIIDSREKTRQSLLLLDDDLTKEEDLAAAIMKAADKLALQQELTTEGINWFRMHWLSLGAAYRKDNYSTYDSALVLSKRIGESDFDKWTLTGAYNFFWQRTDSWIAFKNAKFINSFYANFNYSLIRTNNYEDLNEQSMSISRVRTQNDTIYEFSNSKKLRDISGKTLSPSWLHRLGIVTTTMLGKKQFFGLNITGSVDIRSGKKEVINSHIGMLFRFKDSEKESSLINFELFFAFNDMTDTKDKGKSVWQRKQIGVSATVPFQKVFFR